MNKNKDVIHKLAYGHTAERVVVGTAYARNGNTHNPTHRYRYDVRNAEGRLIGSTHTLKSARALVKGEFYLDVMEASEASSLGDESNQVTVHSLAVDWGLLNQHKIALIDSLVGKLGIPPTPREQALLGVINLLDDLMDQAAEQLGDEAVFGK